MHCNFNSFLDYQILVVGRLATLLALAMTTLDVLSLGGIVKDHVC